jgi:hypothetical protein
MIKSNQHYIWALTTIFLIFSGYARAQRDTLLRQEVEVVKAFSPAAMDAQKINEIPVIKDQDHKKPNFDYSIFSQPVFSTFSVTSLQAATIVGSPKEESGLGMLRLGAGNYNKPYGEFIFNNKNQKNSVFGIHLRHLSSHSKVALESGDRVKAPYSDNEGEMFIKHMFRRSTLSFNVKLDHDGFNYYGYPGNQPRPDTTGIFAPYLGQRQTFTKGGLNINLQNLAQGKSDPSTGFDFSYHHFGTKTGQREHFGTFTMNFKRPSDKIALLLDAGAEHSQTTNLMIDTMMVAASRKQTWLFGKPAIFIGNETINLKLGINGWMVFDSHYKTNFRLTPNVRFNFVPVKELISVYAGVDGNNYHNYYSAVAYHNPFIDPEVSVRNHFEKYRIYGGFAGKFSANTKFRIQADHSTFTGHPFFVLNKSTLQPADPLAPVVVINNVFDVVYDDMKKLKVGGEITHNLGDKLNLMIGANVYKYTPEREEKPWHLPAFDANLGLTYQVTDRMRVATDIYAIGKRDALIRDISDEENIKTEIVPMDMAIDLNVRGSYDITGKISVFAQMNNFGFQKYERWLGYPVQGFNFLGGLSLSF